MDDLERVATNLDAIARRHLPEGVIQHGILRGYESVIRQEALIMAAGGFLQGNKDYQAAVGKKDEDAICAAMEHCMAVALAIVKRRIASRLGRDLAKAKLLTEENGGTCEHPVQHQPHAWPPDVKSIVIMHSVVTAVHQGKLSLTNASIVSMICEHGMAVEKVAEASGISRSAVYQQIWRAKRVLLDVMAEVEIPLL